MVPVLLSFIVFGESSIFKTFPAGIYLLRIFLDFFSKGLVEIHPTHHQKDEDNVGSSSKVLVTVGLPFVVDTCCVSYPFFNNLSNVLISGRRQLNSVRNTFKSSSCPSFKHNCPGFV